MSQPSEFRIDVDKEFPHLANAPIVEAAIHWQAAAGTHFDKARVQDELKRRFPNYDCQAQQEMGAAVQASSEGVEFRQRSRWDGFRLTGRDQADRYVAQFKPAGVVFSRLKPYEHWKPFEAEGLQFWEAYLELAQPPVIERLGVRFINQIMLGAQGKGSEFLKDIPAPPPGIGLAGDLFFYQDSFALFGYPYQVNWLRTVQATPANERVLIVDFDVSTEKIKSVERKALLHTLAEMRFLKNQLFFACMSEPALKRFGKDSDA